MNSGQLLNNRYRLDERIEGGGMGDVWRGRDTRLDRTVAIKVLHSGLSGDPTFRQRFHGEARAVAALQAPGVVNLFDYGEDTSQETGVVSYLIMEFVPGRSLRAALDDRGRIAVSDTLNVIAQAAEALDAAHRAGIVHRDVKPGNILIDPSGGKVKLVDFGIARTRGQSPLTETGAVMGSVSYVSPEALYGQELTGASDVYSLGVVAYECLAGVKPFPGDVPATVISEQLHKDPPPLPHDVPAAVEEVVRRALAKEPGQRWESAAAFAAACQQLRDTGPIDVSEVPEDETVRVAADAIPTTVLARAERGATPPAKPVATSRAAEQEPAGRGSRSRSRAAVVIVAVLGLLTASGVAVALSWRDADSSPPVTGESTAAGTQQQQDTSVEGESASASPTESSPTEQQESSSSSSSSTSSSSSSSSSDKPETAEIPDVVGMGEDPAYDAYADKGFKNVSSYQVGSGSVACEVVEQSPTAGTKEKLNADVSFGVKYAKSQQACSGDGEPSAGSPSAGSPSDGTRG